MTAFALPPPPLVSLPIAGSEDRFPVRRVFCIGQNYADHVREMGGDPKADPPIFFAKFTDSLVAAADASVEVPYPSATENLHHEIELVVALKGGGADIPVGHAAGMVFGWAAGVDLTRRDRQAEAKAAGAPWEVAKAFDAAAPIGPIRPANAGETPSGAIRLRVNGETRQDGRLADLILGVPEIIAAASKLWRLDPGDLIFTGTPQGVGPLVRSDVVEGDVEGVGRVAFTVR